MIELNCTARSFAVGAALLLVGVFGVMSSARAASPDDDVYARCVAAEGTNAGWQACGAAYLGRLDTRLAARWDAVLRAAPDTARSDLAAEQTAWKAYFAASCPLYAHGEFGREGEVIGLPSCRAAIIGQRIAALEELASELASH